MKFLLLLQLLQWSRQSFQSNKILRKISAEFWSKISKTRKSAADPLTEKLLMQTVRELLELNDPANCDDTDSCNDYDKSYRPGIDSNEPLGKNRISAL